MTPDELKDFTILARQVEYQYKLAAFTDEALISAARVLQSAAAEISDYVGFQENILGLDVPGREAELLAALEEITGTLQTEMAARIEDTAITAGRYSYPAYNNIMSFDGAVVGFNSVAVSMEQLASMVAEPVQGRYLSEWLTVSVRDQLNTGVLLGESARALTDRVRDSFDGIERDLISLTRTYVAEVNNRVIADVYQSNRDIIRQEEWNAALEIAPGGRGTCIRCASMDGRRWPVGEGPRPPLHLRCRCWRTPVTVTYREMGLDIDEINAAYRPYTIRDGKFPINVGGERQLIDVGRFQGDFGSFIRTRPVDEQRELLGPGRYDLLRSGAVSWRDFVTPDGELRLLRDLPGG